MADITHDHSLVHPAVEVTNHPKPSLYWQNYGMLFVLLIITVVLYYFDLSKGGWVGTNFVLAMFVATVKAYLVVRNFMNVKNSTKLTFLWAVLGFVWLMLMAGIFLDFRNRPSQGGWEKPFIRY